MRQEGEVKEKQDEAKRLAKIKERLAKIKNLYPRPSEYIKRFGPVIDEDERRGVLRFIITIPNTEALGWGATLEEASEKALREIEPLHYG